MNIIGRFSNCLLSVSTHRTNDFIATLVVRQGDASNLSDFNGPDLPEPDEDDLNLGSIFLGYFIGFVIYVILLLLWSKLWTWWKDRKSRKTGDPEIALADINPADAATSSTNAIPLPEYNTSAINKTSIPNPLCSISNVKREGDSALGGIASTPSTSQEEGAARTIVSLDWTLCDRATGHMFDIRSTAPGATMRTREDNELALEDRSLSVPPPAYTRRCSS